LIDGFAGQVRYLDARRAFLGNDRSLAPSRELGLGQYFVYNRGDKLDWNHPNREGHRLIARWLVEQAILEESLGAQAKQAGIH
jgi:hypothetical protein